ncbi:MAG: DUF433 domain-containing protein [Planctomycetota bacterium]|nr:DUF433 domain-containing protein [Planctomycetota bacterium]
MSNRRDENRDQHLLKSNENRFVSQDETYEKPIRAGRRKVTRLKPVDGTALNTAIGILEERLQNAVSNIIQLHPSDLVDLVTAISLARLAISGNKLENKVQSVQETVTHAPIYAESVVDYPENAETEDFDLTDQYLWRKELEILWKKHITKDEFHRPVVRSLGVPVMVIVNHIRDGCSWEYIRKHYPGLLLDDIRACASMATECGWLSED